VWCCDKKFLDECVEPLTNSYPVENEFANKVCKRIRYGNSTRFPEEVLLGGSAKEKIVLTLHLLTTENW